MGDSRFVILVLDGLRPDLVTPDRMPNLCAFRDAGAVLLGCRAQYPTQTRVNKVSFATGTSPRFHGIHFNKIFVPELSGQPIDLGSYDDVKAAYRRGELITAPGIGRVLAEAGRRFALIHCGFSGAPWLLNYRGDTFGQEHLATAGYQYSTAKVARLVEDRLGAMPAPGGVNLARTSFALEAFTKVIYPELRPDVSLIWSDEPDKSEHVDGLRGPVTDAAIRHSDGLVRTIVEWWRGVAERDNTNLLIVSDHGHVEISQRAAVARLAQEAGLPLTLDPAGKGGVLLPFGGIYQRDLSDQALADVAQWLQAQPWCGNLFSADLDGVHGAIPGTFSKALASIDHPRAPELLFSLRRFDADPDHPLSHSIESGSGPAEGSTHGGLHRTELMNCFFAAGPDFRSRHQSETPGGLIDLVPTMLHVLGIPPRDTMAGRALGDLLNDGAPTADAQPALETFSVGAGEYRQHLSLRKLLRRNVLQHGWRD